MQFRRNRKTGDRLRQMVMRTLADVLQDSFCMEDTCETQDDIRRMRQLLDGLPARERQIILLRDGLAGQPPLTQLETAKLLDISRSYVSRLKLMRWNFCASGGMFRVQKQRRGERCARPCAMQSAIQNFQLQFVQLFTKYTADSAPPPAPFWKDAAADPARSAAFALRSSLPGLPESPHCTGRYR